MCQIRPSICGLTSTTCLDEHIIFFGSPGSRGPGVDSSLRSRTRSRERKSPWSFGHHCYAAITIQVVDRRTVIMKVRHVFVDEDELGENQSHSSGVSKADSNLIGSSVAKTGLV